MVRTALTGNDGRKTAWKLDLALGALLGLGALALFLFFLRDPLGQDDRRMFVFAGRFLDGLRGDSFYAMHFRLGFMLEHAAAQVLLGRTVVAYYAVALFNSTAVICSVFFLMRMFFPRWPALLCAAALATNPYFLSQSSWPQVDWPTGWRFMTGLAFTVLAIRRSGIRPARRLAAGAAAGFFLWWSFYTKLSVAPLLLFTPALLLFVPLDRRTLWAGAVTVCVGVGLLGFGLWMNGRVFGDPLARLAKVNKARTFEYSQSTFLDRGLLPTDLTWSDLILRYPQLYWQLAPGRLFVILAGAAVAVALAARRRELLLFLLLALAAWGSVSLVVTSFDPLVPVLRTKDRYFATVYGLLTILIGGSTYVVWQAALTRASPAVLRSVVRGLMVAGVVVLFGWQLDFHRRHPLHYNPVVTKSWTEQGAFRRMATLAGRGVDGSDVKRVLSDERNLALLQMFFAEDDQRLSPFDTGRGVVLADPRDFHRGDLVYLHYGRLGQNEKKYYTEPIPDFFREPPPNWRRLWQEGKRAIYFVAEDVEFRPLCGDDQGLRDSLRAYPYKDGSGVIRQEQRPDGVHFEIENGDDIRVVIGDKSYYHRPRRKGATAVLHVQRPMALRIQLEGVLAQELELFGGYVVRFRKGQKAPSLHECRLAKDADGRVTVSQMLYVDPSAGDKAFNLLLKLRGSGTFTAQHLEIFELLIGDAARDAQIDLQELARREARDSE